MYKIDKIYGIPINGISCPSCGEKYGHHNTGVDINSQECSRCAKERGNDLQIVEAKYFIESILGYIPYSF